MAGSRLQETQLGHDKRQDATISNRRGNRQTQRGKILQQTGPDLGIQQCPNQGRGQMESCIPNQQRIIRTTSDVLWVMQFTENIPKDDEQYILGITLQRSVSKLHG